MPAARHFSRVAGLMSAVIATIGVCSESLSNSRLRSSATTS